MSEAFKNVLHKGLLLKLKQSRISVNLLKIAKGFLANRSERVLLNGQVSKWFAVHAGALQSSIFGLLLLLIYINGFLKDLSSNLSLFSDDTSLFLVVWDTNLSANALNDELLKINIWAYQWKMSFNPESFKQAQEVIFSCKIQK